MFLDSVTLVTVKNNRAIPNIKQRALNSSSHTHEKLLVKSIVMEH
jgi:hypothetical protein